jgi:hypothetical protein
MIKEIRKPDDFITRTHFFSLKVTAKIVRKSQPLTQLDFNISIQQNRKTI